MILSTIKQMMRRSIKKCHRTGTPDALCNPSTVLQEAPAQGLQFFRRCDFLFCVNVLLQQRTMTGHGTAPWSPRVIRKGCNTGLGSHPHSRFQTWIRNDHSTSQKGVLLSKVTKRVKWLCLSVLLGAGGWTTELVEVLQISPQEPSQFYYHSCLTQQQ